MNWYKINNYTNVNNIKNVNNKYINPQVILLLFIKLFHLFIQFQIPQVESKNSSTMLHRKYRITAR